MEENKKVSNETLGQIQMRQAILNNISLQEKIIRRELNLFVLSELEKMGLGRDKNYKIDPADGTITEIVVPEVVKEEKS